MHPAVVALIALAACNGPGRRVAATPKWTEATSMEPVSKRPACIPQLDSDTQIASAVAEGNAVQFCIGTQRSECFAYDTVTKELVRLDVRPAPRSSSNAYVLTVNPALDVCSAESCQSLAPKVLPSVASIRGATNPSGSTAVFLLGDAPAGKGYAEVWDVAQQKRVATFKYARGELKCGDVAMLGETIYLSASNCKRPTARATLYAKTGRKIASVGGAEFGMFGNSFVQLDDTTWAFLDENATQIAIQDVAKGKLQKTIALAPLFEGATATKTHAGESAIVKLPNGKLVVIMGAPLAGILGLVDVSTGSVEVVRPPSC